MKNTILLFMSLSLVGMMQAHAYQCPANLAKAVAIQAASNLYLQELDPSELPNPKVIHFSENSDGYSVAISLEGRTARAGDATLSMLVENHNCAVSELGFDSVE